MKQNNKKSLAAFFMLTVLFCLFAKPTYSQDLETIIVSIKANNQSLYKTLDDLSKQSGFYFTYDSRLIDSEKLITLNAKNISIAQAIDTLFQQKNLTYQVINKNIVIYPERNIDQAIQTDSIHKVKHLSIAGTVFDKKSKKPLPYATISIAETYFGTISNNDGTFLLRFPDTIQNPILATTYVGFKNQYTPISSNSKDSIKINLNKDVISLQEVVIRYTDPVSLMKESIKRIKNNYLNEQAGVTAYYREKVQKDDKYLIFSEAVVEIAKNPYSTSFKSERTRILKGRKITNIDMNDTVMLKISSGVNSMLQLDIINNLPDFLAYDFFNRYDFHFSDLVSYKDHLVYVITFKQKEFIKELLFRGEVYLDMNTLAIVAANFEYDPLKIRNEAGLFVTRKSSKIKIKPLSANYHVEYRATNDLYHLSQVQGEVKFKIRRKRKWIGSKYQINLDLAVTNLSLGNPPRIPASEQLKPSTILSDENFLFDPDFWGEFTTISPEKSLQESLKNIEKSMLEITHHNRQPNP